MGLARSAKDGRQNSQGPNEGNHDEISDFVTEQRKRDRESVCEHLTAKRMKQTEGVERNAEG